MTLLSANPAKRWAELLLLGYTPVWIAVVALLQLTGCFARWGEAGLLALGVGLALPPWLLPVLLPGPERHVPPADRYLTKATIFIGLLSFIQNDFGADLFFHDLGMQYHFPVRLAWHGTPVFLYFMTVAYFSTYFVLLQVAWRAARAALGVPWPWATRLLHALALGLLSYAVAFGETFFMATERMRPFFSYASRERTLWVGSLCYGTVFFIALPLFDRIDEGPRKTPLSGVVWQALAANTLILLCYGIYQALLFGRP